MDFHVLMLLFQRATHMETRGKYEPGVSHGVGASTAPPRNPAASKNKNNFVNSVISDMTVDNIAPPLLYNNCAVGRRDTELQRGS